MLTTSASNTTIELRLKNRWAGRAMGFGHCIERVGFESNQFYWFEFLSQQLKCARQRLPKFKYHQNKNYF